MTLTSRDIVQERRFVAANMLGIGFGAGTEIDLPGYQDLFVEYRLTGLTGSNPGSRFRYSCIFV